MNNEIHPQNPGSNGGYERSDLSARGVLYFLAGLLVALVLAYFLVDGLYSYLDKRSESLQAPVNPLVTNAPVDTRHISKDYPVGAFPEPRLEDDERGQLNDIRIKEEQTLSTYDYIDKSSGTIRIPIDRAMDLIAQRGLPVRGQSSGSPTAAAPASGQNTAEKKSDEKKNQAKKGEAKKKKGKN